jgi:4-alpha-glucanotransferase
VVVSDNLGRLAAVHGVATSYTDQLQRRVDVSPDTVVAVLAALGVDASTDEEIQAELARAEADRADQVPPVVVLRSGAVAEAFLGDVSEATVRLEDGSSRTMAVTGGLVRLPADLPLGWHELLPAGIPVCVAPHHLDPPEPGWGWMAQLYALRSAGSWGIGDLSDLTTLVEWTAARGGDVVLVNPLHAVAPVTPMQPSPYYPASRRWLNPVYLRIEQLPEYAAIEATIRRHVDALKPGNDGDRIDRDAAWAAKQAALELLFDPADVPEPTGALADYALWAALVEQHGADWQSWPEELQDRHSPEVAAARAELAELIRWHAWLQQRAEEQCLDAHRAARAAGMRIGVMHDLAVGTDAGGADAWVLRDALALGARIGAPPDEFNQQGQDWGMPPWRPAELRRLAYRPIRDMVRAQLRRGGGLRVDHVLGLFRLWWIPQGNSAADGTFVSYDADALLGVIALEAHRAGAVVVGEDLGTVPKEVRTTLADVGVLGTSLLLFEREEVADGAAGALVPPARWRSEAMASVSSHDLPTVRGWLAGEHVRLRGSLGLLRDIEAEQETFRREREELVASLIELGLVPVDADDADDEMLARAMHLALTLTPSRLLFAAPGDAVGDLRQPNLPGTTDEYPNWRLPVSDDAGRVLKLEELLADPRTAGLATDLGQRRPAAGR